MSAPRDVLVSLCVNDPDNGLSTGRCCGVHIDLSDDAFDTLELETGFWNERDNPTFAFERVMKGGLQCAKIRVGRHSYWIGGYRQRYGNWCWDAVTMSHRHARRLVANLLARGFQVTAGPEECDLLPESASPEKQQLPPLSIDRPSGREETE